LTTGTSSSGGGAAGMIGHGSDDDSDLENDDANDDRYGHVDTGLSREVDSDNDEDSEELVPMKDPHKSSSSSSSSAEEEDDDEDNLSFDDGMNVNGTDPQQSQDDDDDEDEAPILIKVDDEENSRDDDDDVSSEDEDEAVGSDSDGENKDSDNDASNDKSDNDVSEDAMDDDDITGSRNSSDDEDEEPQPLTMADRNTQDTYRPVKGQDIYGRAVSVDNTDTKPSKYIPPHLRRLQQQGDQTNKADKHEAAFASSEKDLTMIRRTLNGLLNRLSEDTLDSVAKHLASLYHQPNYIKSDISQCLSEKVMQTCVSKEQLMGASTPLMPLYASTVAAAHMCVEGGAVGSHVVECLVTAFLNKHEEARQACREKAATDTSTQIIQQKYSKESLNLILLLSYLYSFQMVFCTLIYDIIKDLIASFTEVDVEALLLILQHAGFQLRGDDPAALKDIVMLVQERAVGALNSNTTDTNTNTEAEEDNNASRIRYMVSAISDLKNNKRSKADVAQIEKIKRFRKFLGRVKTTAAAEGDAGGYRPGQDTCLRISLQDIRDIPTKGRWWKVGSSWKGNQFLGHDDGNAMDNDTLDRKPGPGSIKRRNKNNNEEDTDPLLTLAAKLGMNTDVRKSIFCIIMGSDDCEDAFEKLTKLGLQGQQDRELVRVLVECCGQEKTYNPYYALLAARLCEWSPKQSKFTFQKVYWDMFGQLLSQDDDEHENNKVKIKIRKVANLAKLFVDLLKERHLSMALLKALDMTELPEAGIIFLTMTLTVLFDSSEPAQVYSIFEAIPVNESGVALRENLSVFLLQYLQKSPKNVKKSKFHKSYKIAVKLCKADAMTMQQEEMF
jgi:nucleolar MIF4G domain-containing protein 1